MKKEANVFQLNLEDVLPNRFQPRIKFSERAINELSESIKEHGVIQPIVVRQIGDKYEIIAGERRFKASVLAGKETIPAIISDLDDRNSAEIALIENVQREDLTAIEEAISYKKILDMGYINQIQLAQKLGKEQSTIANKLRLLNLDETVQEALLEGEISERHARSLLRLSHESQVDLLEKIINERLTVRKTDQEIDNMLGKPKKIEVIDFSDSLPKTKEENMKENNLKSDFIDVDKIVTEAKDIFVEKPKEEQPQLVEVKETIDNVEGESNSNNKFFNFIPELEEQPAEPKIGDFDFGFVQNEDKNETDVVVEPTVEAAKPQISTFDFSSFNFDDFKDPNVSESNDQKIEESNLTSDSSKIEPEQSLKSDFEPELVADVKIEQNNNIEEEANEESVDIFDFSSFDSSSLLNKEQNNGVDNIEAPKTVEEVKEVTNDDKFDFNSFNFEEFAKTAQPKVVENSVSETNVDEFDFDFDFKAIKPEEKVEEIPMIVDEETHLDEKIEEKPKFDPNSFDFSKYIKETIENNKTNSATTAEVINEEMPPFTANLDIPSGEPVVVPQLNRNFKEALNIIRKTSEDIEKLGFSIDVDEFDFEDVYQIIFKVNKE